MKRSPKALVRGMRVLVVLHYESGEFDIARGRLVYDNRDWFAADKRGVTFGVIDPEDEGITWVRGWSKISEHARALQAAMALS